MLSAPWPKPSRASPSALRAVRIATATGRSAPRRLRSQSIIKAQSASIPSTSQPRRPWPVFTPMRWPVMAVPPPPPTITRQRAITSPPRRSSPIAAPSSSMAFIPPMAVAPRCWPPPSAVIQATCRPAAPTATAIRSIMEPQAPAARRMGQQHWFHHCRCLRRGRLCRYCRHRHGRQWRGRQNWRVWRRRRHGLRHKFRSGRC